MEKKAFKIQDARYWYIYTADDLEQAARFHMETYGLYDTDLNSSSIIELNKGDEVQDEFGNKHLIETLVGRELFAPSLISTNRD